VTIQIKKYLLSKCYIFQHKSNCLTYYVSTTLLIQLEQQESDSTAEDATPSSSVDETPGKCRQFSEEIEANKCW
jgi:hypothetical protein